MNVEYGSEGKLSYHRNQAKLGRDKPRKSLTCDQWTKAYCSTGLSSRIRWSTERAFGPVALDRTRVAYGTDFFLGGGRHERGSDRYLAKAAYPTTAIRLNWSLTSLEKA